MRFKLYRKTLSNSNFYKSWTHKFLRNEIKIKWKCVRELELKVAEAYKTLKQVLSSFDFVLMTRVIRINSQKFNDNITKRHNSKLLKLGLNPNLQTDPNKVIQNFSDIHLTKDEKRILSLGLNFKLPVFKINFYHYFLKFEKLYLSLREFQQFNPRNRDWVSDLKSVASKYYLNFKKNKVMCSVFKPSDFSILKRLKNNHSVIITRPDKGHGVVLLNRSDYISKLTNILSDSSKFIALNTDPFQLVLKIEDKLNCFLRKLKLLKDVYHEFYTSGCTPGVVYGLPKTRKSGVPLQNF